MGHVHFLNDKICISWVPMKPSTVFFSCRTPEKSTKKAGLEVCGSPVLNPEKKTYLHASHLEGLFSLFLVHKLLSPWRLSEIMAKHSLFQIITVT